MKIYIGPLLLLITIVVGWLIEYLNARRTNNPRKKLRSSLLILFIGACAWGIYINRQDAKDKEKIEQQHQTTQHKMDEIAESVKQLGLTPKILLEKFPLGYAIFEINYRNDVFLYDNKLLDKYELDWGVAGLKKTTPDRYEFRLPDIKSKDGKPILTNIIVSGPIEIGGWEGGAQIGTLGIACRVLDIKKNGIVFLVYFVEMPANLKQPNTPSSDKPQ